MKSKWIGADGYPCEFSESREGAALIEAIRALPGGLDLSAEALEGHARALNLTALHGRNEELPRNRPASLKASERELYKLADLSNKLEKHILSMHQPSVTALYSHGVHVFELVRQLQETQELARWAFGMLDEQSAPKGAPPKVGAAEVAFHASRIFQQVTGRRPTFTTDTSSGAVSGAWPKFLASIFDALRIDASAGSQVRQVSE